MLASTVKFSKYNRHPTPNPDQLSYRRGPRPEETSRHTPETRNKPGLACVVRSFRTQQRVRHPPDHHHVPLLKPASTCVRRPGERQIIDVPPLSTPHQTFAGGEATAPQTMTAEAKLLLRKEVIQPHLPVRLPCYDLVPIASPTFDGSPHKGWATGFGCYRLS